MKILGINALSRACVYDVLLYSENGSVFVVDEVIITRIGFMLFVEHNGKLAFYTLEEVVEEVLGGIWKE